MKNRTLVTGAAFAAIVLAPSAAIATDHVLNANSVSVASAAQAPSQGSGSSGSFVDPNGSSSNGSSSNGSSSNDGSGATTPGFGWPGQQSQTTSTPTISGTKVSSAPGVVMIDTVLPGGEGAGTGIVLKSNGTILTNYHVVEGSTQIRVTDSNGKTYTGTVVGHDETHDIAVVKINASGLTTAKLDTDGVTTGEAVTAIGQGGGTGSLYKTSGTITNTSTQITASDDGSGAGSETLYGLLETNAQIVPGYSGGALVDAQGEVVGMDTAASGSEPISGFAIPINSATKIANQIETGTRSSTTHIGARAALGVEIPASNTGRSAGAYVQGVADSSAAASAGVTAGSTITAVAGQTVTGTEALTTILDHYYPGQRVSVQWVDATGAAHTATVTLGTATSN